MGDNIEGDQDLEEECKEKCDSGEGIGSSHMWVEDTFVRETQDTQIWCERCVEAREGCHGQHYECSFDMNCRLFLYFMDNLWLGPLHTRE